MLQISDCHLATEPQSWPQCAHEPRAMLQKARAFAPQFLLASDDLSEDASPASYHALQKCYSCLEVPALALPGNHDAATLLEAAAFLHIIDRYTDVKAVLWGHVHQAFEADRHGTAMLAGPSSAINSLPGAQKFTPDPASPACR